LRQAAVLRETLELVRVAAEARGVEMVALWDVMVRARAASDRAGRAVEERRERPAFG
jgi:hypothetical protein